MIIFDTETTGFIDNWAIPLKRQPHIIELFALKVDDAKIKMCLDEGATAGEFQEYCVKQGRSWHSLFNARVSEEIQKVTNITPEMVADAPKFAERWESLADFMRGERYLAGHNLAFDRDMLAIELRRLAAEFRFPWPTVHICTVEHTEDHHGFRLGLTQLHEELFGEAFQEAHRAEADVMATARCTVELIRRGEIQL